MALPVSLPTVNVRGTYLKASGLPESGKVIIYADTNIQSTTDKTIVGPLYFEGVLDINGYVNVDVPPTNNPSWAPLNYTYHVKEVLSSGVRSYYIAVPYNTAGMVLDLATVAPVQNNPDPTMYILVNQANQPGGYAKIDPVTGKISSTVVPAGGGTADGAFRGNWSSASAYILGDTVLLSGVPYGALQNSTNQNPATQAAFWQPYNGGSQVVVRSATITTGDVLAPNNAAWTLLPGFSLSIPAVAGEWVELISKCMFSFGGSTMFYSFVVTGAANAIARYSSSGSATPAPEGDPGMYPSPGSFRTAAGAFGFTVAASDINAGTVTFGIACKGTSDQTAKVYASANYPFWWRAMNYRVVG